MFQVAETYASATDSVWLCAAVAMHASGRGTRTGISAGDVVRVRSTTTTIQGPHR